jgi:hypothetical protein
MMISDLGSVMSRFLEKAPISSPEYVAQKIVEGFRQNYEHLILPPRDVVLALIR